tara:strand:- start:37 stop:1098 length:1062 start_codon:yes stop_codon:yes gene_type:complete
MSKGIIEVYQKQVNRKRAFIFLSLFVMLFLIALGISIGVSDTSFRELIDLLNGRGDYNSKHIFLNLRLPRVLSAIVVGFGLSMSGSAMQSILRNPLGSPFTLGISSAAAFGAAFAVIFLGAMDQKTELIIPSNYLIASSAFFWSLISTALILLIAKFKDASPETMILTGIIGGSFFTAATTSLQYFAEDTQLANIVFWTFGDLGKASWRDFLILLIISIPACFYFIKIRWNIRSLNSGDEVAKSLGVNVNKTRIQVMLVASLLTATAVSIFGIIAFIGLVVPHLVRRFVGNNEQFLIPATAIFGGIFLLISDLIARMIISPMILPVGVITSFIGAPLFIFLLVKGKVKRSWQN